MSREGVRVEKERVEKECEYRRSARRESREGVRVEKEKESGEGVGRERVRVEKEVEKEWVEKDRE